jgi:hypothetical protein
MREVQGVSATTCRKYILNMNGDDTTIGERLGGMIYRVFTAGHEQTLEEALKIRSALMPIASWDAAADKLLGFLATEFGVSLA